MFATLNWLAVVVAALGGFAVGFIWYMPQVFGTMWMKEMKISKKEADAKMKKDGMAVPMLKGFVGQVVTAAVLAVVFGFAVPAAPVDAALLAGLIAIGFPVTQQFGRTIWGKDSCKLFCINAAHTVVSYAVMGAILVLM